ncbi:hypothetical protein QYE76_049239 [Lolium multiflorum]|uniref:DUF4219 domain-containing protein n=1 Tax=Lolium multiflorum TaxID=4521 RepID=A0AAD8SNT3_LOLMU|nr:hypothetical protein QYE76_049239 [Lolium multiflorum]
MGEKSPNNGHRSSSGGGKYTPAAARRAAGSDADGGAMVLPTPSRVTNVPLQYPSLTDTNYPLWAAKMKILMKPLRVWSAIEGTGEYDQAADEGAFAALSQSVQNHIVLQTIPEFAKKRIPLVSEIRSLDVKLEEEAVVERLFSTVPDRFGDIINTIEQWGDVTTMTVQEAVGRL